MSGIKRRERPLKDIVFDDNLDKRVLEFLETHPEFDYTPNEIRNGIGEKWTRIVNKSLARLLRDGKIAQIRHIQNHKNWSYQVPEWLERRGPPQLTGGRFSLEPLLSDDER